MHMSRRMLAPVIVTLWTIGTLGGLLPAPLLDVHAESFNVKPGAWEMTVTTVTSGMKLSPERSAKMTPAQRAQMEQMMNAQEGKPHTMTSRSCITPEDLSQDEDTAVRCKLKVLSKSSSKLVLDQLCPGPPSSTTHFTIEAKTPERIAAIGNRSETGSGKSRLEIKGKWLDTGCDGLEE
jgi:Protein of unknown function (DUF3617)